MRRPLLHLFALFVAAGVGCGIDAVATKTFDTPSDGGAEGGPNLPPPGEGGVSDAAVDAPIDAAPEASLVRPDAGVPFEPSHIQPVYSFTAPAVVIDSETTVDTSARTIALNGGAAAVSPDIVHSDGAAIWSVDSLTANARLKVIGDRALVIVARGSVTINATVSAFGSLGVPGAGGSLPASGPGKGTNGTKVGSDASGGGGAGHGTDGAAGGDKTAAVKGGALGPTSNAAGALVGGSGGGHGGGFAIGTCGGRGRGGAGGGAIQISAVGQIVVNSAGGIDVGGGGGKGGCKNNGGDKYTGGGGGGAGGLVFFEAVGGIVINFGATLEASGGAGGEGGDNNTNGADGEDGQYPSATAIGGFGAANGGNGGNGGNVFLVALPMPGSNGGDTGGGGGGATGRVFLRTRGAAQLNVTGTVSAQRTDDPTF